MTLQTTHAQNASVNMKGRVVDESTLQPVGLEMDMVIVPAKNPAKKIKVSVNSKSGEYLQPLTSGDVYTLRFESYGVYYKEEVLDIPATSKYREEKREFKVKRIIKGQVLADAAVFDAQQKTISTAANDALQQVLDVMKKNANLQIVVKLNEEIVPPPPAKKETKSVKKVKGKKVDVATEPAPTPVSVLTNEELYTQRMAALKNYFSQVKDAEIRVTFEKGQAVTAGPGVKNVSVVIGEVKSLIEE